MFDAVYGMFDFQQAPKKRNNPVAKSMPSTIDRQ